MNPQETNLPSYEEAMAQARRMQNRMAQQSNLMQIYGNAGVRNDYVAMMSAGQQNAIRDAFQPKVPEPTPPNRLNWLQEEIAIWKPLFQSLWRKFN
jgi:hypothetical protein